jgi:uncharacterized caspase-like protein
MALIDHSPARKVVVWLDCCYGGTFPTGMTAKADGTVDVVDQLTTDTGRGCVVMTASTHIQYAYERGVGTTPTGQAGRSVFADAIVLGLCTGAADFADDGLVDTHELYDYVYEHVRDTTPDQTPTCKSATDGKLYVARRATPPTEPTRWGMPPTSICRIGRVWPRSPWRWRIRSAISSGLTTASDGRGPHAPVMCSISRS